MSPCSERDIVRKIVLYLALVAILVGGGGGGGGGIMGIGLDKHFLA